MSRRKDRERFAALKDVNPDYQGFRGPNEEPPIPQSTTLEKVTCSNCGRTRNVPVGSVDEQGDNYICLSCREEADQETSEDDTDG